MTSRSNGLLDRPSVENIKQMNKLSHRLCVAPMMDWNDSFSVSIGCAATCAERVHERTAIYFAGALCGAIFVRRVQVRSPPLVPAIRVRATWGSLPGKLSHP